MQKDGTKCALDHRVEEYKVPFHLSVMALKLLVYLNKGRWH